MRERTVSMWSFLTFLCEYSALKCQSWSPQYYFPLRVESIWRWRRRPPGGLHFHLVFRWLLLPLLHRLPTPRCCPWSAPMASPESPPSSRTPRRSLFLSDLSLAPYIASVTFPVRAISNEKGSWISQIIEAEKLQLKRYPNGKTRISFFPFSLPSFRNFPWSFYWLVNCGRLWCVCTENNARMSKHRGGLNTLWGIRGCHQMRFWIWGNKWYFQCLFVKRSHKTSVKSFSFFLCDASGLAYSISVHMNVQLIFLRNHHVTSLWLKIRWGNNDLLEKREETRVWFRANLILWDLPDYVLRSTITM